MNKVWLAPILGTLLLLGSVPANAEDRIVFLRVRFDSTGVALESTSVVPGKLKSGSDVEKSRPAVRFRVQSGDATTLHSATIEDPRYVVRETSNEDGTLQTIVEERASAVTVIRFPFDPRAARVEFALAAPPTPSSKALPLGSLQLDLSDHAGKK